MKTFSVSVPGMKNFGVACESPPMHAERSFTIKKSSWWGMNFGCFFLRIKTDQNSLLMFSTFPDIYCTPHTAQNMATDQKFTTMLSTARLYKLPTSTVLHSIGRVVGRLHMLVLHIALVPMTLHSAYPHLAYTSYRIFNWQQPCK